MKQILALLLAAVMCMSLLTGCRRNNTSNKNNTTTTPNTENSVTDRVEDTVEEGVDDLKNGVENVTDDVANAVTGHNLRADATLEEIVMKLGEELGINMPQKMDEAHLRDVLGIQPEWVEEYYGEYSAANTSADHLMAFKVKSGHVNEVKEALDKRREAIANSFEESLLQEQEKARNATIVEKGDYLFFIIAGDVTNESDKEVNRAREIIDSYFE